MKPKLLALVLLALCLVGLAAPIVPTWWFVAYGPIYSVDELLSENDAAGVLRSVRDSQGLWISSAAQISADSL